MKPELQRTFLIFLKKNDCGEFSGVSEVPESGFESSRMQKGHKTINKFLDASLRDFFYRLYTHKLKIDGLEVIKMISKEVGQNFVDRPAYAFVKGAGMYYSSDPMLMITVRYMEKEYERVMFIEQEFDPSASRIVNHIYTTCISPGSLWPEEFVRKMTDTSLKHSSFRNSLLLFDGETGMKETENFIEMFEKAEPGALKVSELYIPSEKKEEIERFIYAVEHYNEDRINLRYLLSGPPGTGKTQLMSSVANRLHGKAMVIIAKGSNSYLPDLISFSGLFEPVVLMIDDIDLAIGTRENTFDKRKLGIFLQQLDGFLPQPLFIIAVTNDKRLVDMAASRPGRFDLILDTGEMSFENYAGLIRRETDDREIISLFDDGILKKMKSRNVTGAFIVSLVKQLRSRKKMNGYIRREEMNIMFDMQHRGFYSNNAKAVEESVGFNN